MSRPILLLFVLFCFVFYLRLNPVGNTFAIITSMFEELYLRKSIKSLLQSTYPLCGMIVERMRVFVGLYFKSIFCGFQAFSGDSWSQRSRGPPQLQQAGNLHPINLLSFAIRQFINYLLSLQVRSPPDTSSPEEEERETKRRPETRRRTTKRTTTRTIKGRQFAKGSKSNQGSRLSASNSRRGRRNDRNKGRNEANKDVVWIIKTVASDTHI